MLVCKLCHFETELDDVVVGPWAGNHCICLRCFGRETGSARPMSKELRRDIVSALKELELA